MKKILATALLALAATSSFATVWLVNGVWVGNVCRNGAYYTVYPSYDAQPIGSSCAIINGYGQVIGYGWVSNE